MVARRTQRPLRGSEMTLSRRDTLTLVALGGASLSTRTGGAADKAYGPGVTDTEIKIGQTAPYRGPASAAGVIGRSAIAYYRMINDQGGVNGRKINLLSLDDAYTPLKTVEQVRRLVEQEAVLGMFGMVGAAPSAS